MNRLICFFMLIALLGAPVRAQTDGFDIAIWEDTRAYKSIEAFLASPDTARFAPQGHHLVNFGLSENWFWVKISLKKPLAVPFLLKISEPNLDAAELYGKNAQNRWERQAKRRYERHSLPTFLLKPHENGVYYLHIKGDTQPVPLEIVSEAQFLEQDIYRNLKYGFFYGLFGFIILNNLILGFLSRSREHFLYVGIVLTYLADSLVVSGYAKWAVEWLSFERALAIPMLVSIPFMAYYAKFFLKIERKSKIDVFLNYLAWASAPSLLVQLFLHGVASIVLAQIMGIFNLCAITFVAYRALGKGKRHITYYFWAFLSFAFCVSLQILYTNTGYPPYFVISYVEWGWLFEILLLSLALNVKINSEREALQQAIVATQAENLRLAHAQKVELEEKVLERTAALEERNRELMAHEEELRIKNEELLASEEEINCALDEVTTVKNNLEASEYRFRAILDSSADSIMFIDATGELLAFNEKSRLFAQAICGRELELGDNLLACLPAEQEKLCQKMQKALNGSPCDLEFEVGGAWIYARYFPVYNEHGLTGVTQIMSNITKRKRAERDMREMSSRLSLATLGNGIGIWDYDVLADRLIWDNQMFKLHHVDKNTFTYNYAGWLAAVCKEDRETAGKQAFEALKDRDDLILHIRVPSPPDKIKHLEVLAMVQRDEAGKAIRAIGTSQDITARKIAEESLRRKQEMLIANQHELEKTLMELYNTQNVIVSQKRALENTLTSLQEAQEQLIQSEKMASLGQLVASIAHEINTPLGAIRSSVESSGTYLQSILATFPHFWSTLSANEHRIFIETLDKITQLPPTNLSTREKRQARHDITDQLEALGIEAADEVAEFAVESGAKHEILAWQTLLDAPCLLSIVDMLGKVIIVRRSNQNIQVAVDRASKIVFALKNFSRQDHSHQKVPTNINESIETVLTLYHNLLKQGIDLVRRYADLPEVMCYHDELVQVWTNLVHNAIQAMAGKGTLTIETRQTAGKIVASFADSGHGIPKEIQPKIFDAFFTTKKVGEGSGLGLDIVKKIVEKHEGRIWFESQEGEGTTFFVEIPI